MEEVVGVARRRPNWTPSKLEWVQADLAVEDLQPVMTGADAVVHLAWSFHPTRDSQMTWKNNVLGSMRVFQAAAAARVAALVHASSVGAYSPAADDHPVDESWPTHALPHAGYGREKSYLERVLDTFERDNPEVRLVRLRPGFIFKRSSAASQRRYFVGPFLPNPLVRPGLVPIVPDLPGLRFQALHTRDAAEAYRLALVGEARGAFNIAAEPVIDPTSLAELLDARSVRVPVWMARAAIAAAFRLHLVPATPALFDLALSLPVMDTTRAQEELGWRASTSALEAVAEVMTGIREERGGPTPPLAEDAGGHLRSQEFTTGLGGTAGVTDDGR